MHKINLYCPKCMFKGKLLKRQCWLSPFVHLKRCHFLILRSILLKIIAKCAKRIAFNNNTQVLCRYVEICWKIKTALPVYFLLPLSIFRFLDKYISLNKPKQNMFTVSVFYGSLGTLQKLRKQTLIVKLKIQLKWTSQLGLSFRFWTTCENLEI